MSDLGGTYDFTVDSPMGEQRGTMTVEPGADGNSFSGTVTGAMGTMDVEDGTIDGNTLRWKMKMSSPMPMTLDCEASVDEAGEAKGHVDAGMMGKMPFRATKQG